MSPAGITTSLTHDLEGLPTWELADGSTVSRSGADVLTIARPGRPDIRGRLLSGETYRHAYDRLLELDALQVAAPLVYVGDAAAVTVEADVAGQSVTLRAHVQLRRGAPEVLYATSAEVRGCGEGALCVGDMLRGEDVTEDMVASVEAVLVEAWAGLEAA